MRVTRAKPIGTPAGEHDTVAELQRERPRPVAFPAIEDAGRASARIAQDARAVGAPAIL